jgi:hypothetical protein
VRFVLARNIICGDALSLKQVDANGKDTDEPVVFSEWAFVTGSMLKRRDFRLDEMLDGHTEQVTWQTNNWVFDEEIQAFIPKPIAEYPPIDYRRVWEVGE